MSKKIGPLKSYSCILHTGKTALESRTGIYTEIHLGIIEYYCRRLDVTFSMHMSTAVVGHYSNYQEIISTLKLRRKPKAGYVF